MKIIQEVSYTYLVFKNVVYTENLDLCHHHIGGSWREEYIEQNFGKTKINKTGKGTKACKR